MQAVTASLEDFLQLSAIVFTIVCSLLCAFPLVLST